MTWMDRAACTGADPEMFFDGVDNFAATSICAGCPVRMQCLDYGIATRSSGIFGGVSLDGRRPLPMPDLDLLAVRLVLSGHRMPLDRPETDEVIRRLRKRGCSPATIADRLGVNTDQVRRRIDALQQHQRRQERGDLTEDEGSCTVENVRNTA